MKNVCRFLLSRLLLLVLVATAGPAFAQPVSPTVSTLPASAVGATNATLNGIGNPHGEVAFGFFQWGTTTNYGNVTPAQPLGSGFGDTNFSQAVSGLLLATTYHFRAVASNSSVVVFGTNQSFTTPPFMDIGAGLPGIYRYGVAAAGWGDYDNDGRLDLLLSDQNTFQVWRNTGSGFTNINAGFSSPFAGQTPTPWGDFDNDGNLDLLGLTLYDSSSFQVWRNTGAAFTNVGANPPGAEGAGTWGDFNNDGLLDIITVGLLSSTCRLRQNTGSSLFNNYFISVSGLGLPTSVDHPFLAAGDYDNDGLLDLFLGSDDYFTSPLWRNTGNGFANFVAAPLDMVQRAAAWGDYNNDGLLDLLLTGFGSNSIPIAQVWRNTGNGFTNINAGLTGCVGGGIGWGDYDNDGRLDILLSGGTGISPNNYLTGLVSQVWRNTGNGFSNINAGLPGTVEGAAAWGDYDNDGRLDILLAGATNINPGNGALVGVAISQIWRNNTPVTNTPPTAPTGLTATINSNDVTFSWNAASDAQTPASGLTYNLRIGTSPGGSDLLGPMAAANGQRRLPQMGNAQEAHLRTIHGLPLARPIYWSVQAIDTAFAGGPFAAEKTLTLNTVLTPPNGVPVSGDTNGDGIVNQSELDVVLAKYFPYSPWLYLTNVAGLGGTNVTFALSNSTAGAFSVEYSTNLSNWFLLGPATPRYLFTDTNAPAIPQRYYRLRWP